MRKRNKNGKPTIGVEEIRAIPVGSYKAFAIVDHRHGRSIYSNCRYYNETEGAETGVQVKVSLQYDNGVAVISKTAIRE